MLVILSMLDRVSNDTGCVHSITAVGLESDSCCAASDDIVFEVGLESVPNANQQSYDVRKRAACTLQYRL